jgi:hypothetical protein
VGACDDPELLRPVNAREGHELGQIALVSAAGLRIVDVGEPGQSRRHVGELVELRGGQCAFLHDNTRH